MLLAPALAFAAGVLPPGVEGVDMGAGRLLVTSEGRTLYAFEQDREQQAASLCLDECATLWPPLTAAPDAGPIDDWTLIQRPDGSRQWAYRGNPVHTHARDTHPGAIIGEKAFGPWAVLFEPIATPAAVQISATPRGQMLVDVDGRTLYRNVGAACDKACMKDRRPLAAPWLARASSADWTVVNGGDGLPQWAYRNQPLFTYAGDYRPGDVHGEDPEHGWEAVVPQAAPAVPDWVTVQETDLGPVLADQARMTLYYLTEDPEKITRETCDAACVAENWRPVTAAPDAEPVGNWSLAPREDGARQWTYLGLPVFTYRHDRMPGDINGDKFGGGVNTRGGWQAIQQETLTQTLF